RVSGFLIPSGSCPGCAASEFQDSSSRRGPVGVARKFICVAACVLIDAGFTISNSPSLYHVGWPPSPATSHEFKILQRARRECDGVGIRATTLIAKSKPASQLTPTAVQFG